MRNLKRILALLVVFSMLFAMGSNLSFAGNFRDSEITSSLSFTTLSDLHIYPYSLTGDNCKAWQEYCKTNSKLFRQSEEIIRTAVETIVLRNPELKYILVPGDLTKDSEYEAHLYLANILEEYEEEYGVEFIVTTGNHDINQTKAVTYENGYEESTRALQANEFKEVYANLGYDLAFDEYANDGENKQGQLSYAVDLLDNNGNEAYRLIVVDSSIYSFPNEEPKNVTGGVMTEELLSWVKMLAEDAYENGKTPMIMLHHGLAPHVEFEKSITKDFLLTNYHEVAEKLASWGIHYAFSGHLHTNDIGVVINDDGEALYDCETASVTGYPCTYREMTINTFANGESEMSFTTVDFDDKAQFSFDGVTYENGTFKNTAFGLGFGSALSEDGSVSAENFLMAVLRSVLSGVLSDIKESGSVENYLKTLDIDLYAIIDSFLSPYIGDGIKIGAYNIFTTENIMWFINDLLGQVYSAYIEDPEELFSFLQGVVHKITSYEVSDYPCTAFIDEFGFGDENKNGTIGDLIMSMLVYWYTGNEDTSSDLFVQDAIDKFENGSTLHEFFYYLIDIVLSDVLEDGILKKLEIRVDKLFADDYISKHTGEGINYLLSYVLKGDFSYYNLVDTILNLGILPWESLYDILDKEVITRYLTESQLEGIGVFVAEILKNLCVDEDPIFKGDHDVTYNTLPKQVEATRENYRLPSMVSVTLGEDSSSSANISWYSKWTVDGDIEIYKADEFNSFTGTPTTESDFDITINSEQALRSYPGIDIGIAGLFPYEFKINRHIAKIEGLESNTTYYYRVGSAERNWWSETGTITTANGSDNVTFLHLTDPQSQNERQYDRAWARTLESALTLYPNTDFIINTGDFVDHGDNIKQWGWMFNTASEQIMNTFMMPTSGNHEGMGTNAIANYFAVPGAPEQDLTGGVYYSFDYNNVHIAVLNTENLDEDETLNDEQINWLKEDMSSSDAKWKIVALHKALYSNGPHYKDDDVCALRNELSYLMTELNIDLVLQGHDHVYLRTSSLSNGGNTAYESTYLKKGDTYYRTQIQPVGTTYVISGTSGVKPYLVTDARETDKLFPRAVTTLPVENPMFSSIEIIDGVLYFNAYTVGEGEAVSVDRFAIQKDTTQGEAHPDYVDPDYKEPEQTKEKSLLLRLLELMLKLVKIIYKIGDWYFF